LTSSSAIAERLCCSVG